MSANLANLVTCPTCIDHKLKAVYSSTFWIRILSIMSLCLSLEVLLHFISSGHVFSGLRVHPDREHLIYPLGSTVILKRIKDGKQEFLHGHTNNISCISVSKSGSYIASGQVNFMGFKVAAVMIHSPSVKWQFFTLCGTHGSTVFTEGIVLALHGTGLFWIIPLLCWVLIPSPVHVYCMYVPRLW